MTQQTISLMDKSLILRLNCNCSGTAQLQSTGGRIAACGGKNADGQNAGGKDADGQNASGQRPGPGLRNCCGPGPGLKLYLRAGPGPRIQARVGH